MELNKENFERACELQTSTNAVESLFGVSKQEIENWCEKTYSKSFAEAHFYFAIKGKEKLIEVMIETAKEDHEMEKYLIKSAKQNSITQKYLIKSAKNGNCEAIKILKSLKK